MSAEQPAHCAACGSPHDPGQEYCLECGAPIRPRSRRPHWIWPSLAALLIAVAGGAVAIAASGKEVGSAPRTLVATEALVTVPLTTTTRRAPTPTAPKPAPVPATAPQGGGLVAWPGGDRYTIVLSSFPLRSGIGGAKATAEEALRAGLGDVGVLVSSSYASLHPGLYIVFSGVYSSLEDAQSDLSLVTPRFPSAYAQRIVG